MKKTGFLCFETRPDHPGLVRVILRYEMPSLEDEEDASGIRYIARFKDAETARMEIQNALPTALVDPDTRIYRAELNRMIAHMEASELEHQRVWIDPQLEETQRLAIEQMTEGLRRKRNRIDRFWQWAGYLAIGLLLLSAFVMH